MKRKRVSHEDVSLGSRSSSEDRPIIQSSAVNEELAAKLRHRSINFIAKNIEEAGKRKTSHTSWESELSASSKTRSLEHNRSRSSSTTNRKNSASSRKSRESSKKGLLKEPKPEEQHQHLPNEQHSDDVSALESIQEGGSLVIKTSPPPKPDSTNNDEKYRIKQTTCEACMEKWRTPLPTPKTTDLIKRKPSWLMEDATESEFEVLKQKLKVDSLHRITTLIENEKYKLNAYNVKYSKLNYASPPKKKKTDKSSSEHLKLDVYAMEKIKHEMRLQETQTKLEKFLELEKNPVKSKIVENTDT